MATSNRVIAGKRRGLDQQQLTLYAYQTKKSKVESGSESSECDNLCDTYDSDSHDDDATAAVSKTKATVSGDETMHQDNRITLDKPSGSKTIIINNRSTSSTGQTSGIPITGDVPTAVPSDISVGPHQPPVQPRIRYPSSFAGTKRRAFN